VLPLIEAVGTGFRRWDIASLGLLPSRAGGGRGGTVGV